MPYRVTWFYQQVAGDRTAGWTESFWSLAASEEQAVKEARLLFNKLDYIHGGNAFSSSFRVTDVEDFRAGEDYDTGIVGPAVDSNVYPEGDYPVMALQLVTRSLRGKTTQWVRGIPDEICEDGGKYNPKGQFNTRFKAFVAALVSPASSWVRRYLDPSNERKPITVIDLQSGVLTIPQHGMGDDGLTIRVRVTGFQEPRSVNKVWRATIVDANTISLSFFTPISDEEIDTINPLARKQEYIFDKITSAEVKRITSHKTGRPTKLLSGRSANRSK